MTETLTTKTELQKVLSLFKGQTCWNVSSCGMAHSIHLYFGKAIEEKVSYNPKNDSCKRQFGGQYELVITCSWRLDDENHTPILSSEICNYHEIKTTTISLIGDSIESIEAKPPVWEATIYFSSGKRLITFCDWIPDKERDMDGMLNWWCDTEKETYYFGPGQSISKEERCRLVSDTLYDPEEIDPAFIISDKNYKPKETEEQEPEDSQGNDDDILMKLESSKEELLETLSLFKGLNCWNVYTRKKSRFLSLSFGKAIEVKYYSTKDTDIKDRVYLGQFELEIDCTWRLDNEHGIPILSSSYKSDISEIKTTTVSLIGDFIESIDIESPIHEATIRFTSGKQLRVFCDWIPGKGGIPNWYCDTVKETYFIGPGRSLSKVKRKLISEVLYEPDQLDPEFIISDLNYTSK